MVQDVQHSNWCFTYCYGGAGQPQHAAVVEFWEGLCDLATYAIGGWEVAPETGQLHMQGYVQFESKKRLSQLKKLKNALTVHWEVAKGDDTENFEYCSKSGSYEEFGEARSTHSGKREKKRWRLALDLAKSGTYDDIDPQIQVQFMKNLDYIRDKFQPRLRDLPPGSKNLWIWGPTRSGKSRRARQIFAERYQGEFYNKLQNKWWDHYETHRALPALIDDLEMEQGKALTAHLKQWLDIYSFKVEYKGGAKDIRPPLIIITSNFHPWDIWGEKPEAWYEPIMQRLDILYVGSTPSDVPPPKGPAVLILPDVPTTGLAISTNADAVKSNATSDVSSRNPANGGATRVSPDGTMETTQTIDLTQDF